MQHDAAHRALDPDTEFEQPLTQRAHLGMRTLGTVRFQSQLLHQHVRSGGEQYTKLVGEEVRAARAVNLQSVMKLLDAIFHLAGVIELMAQRELKDFAYASVKDQRLWLRDREIDPFVRDEQYDQVVELQARRNLFVHTNGYVNDIYLSLVPNSPLKRGERAAVSDQYLTDVDRVLYVVSNQFFYLVRQKFCGDDQTPEIQDSETQAHFTPRAPGG